MNFLKSDHLFIAISYWILRKVIGLPIRLLLIKKVTGIQNLPQNNSAILAFNHQSFFDFLCFASISPRNVHFLSAEKFFDHKLWRVLMILTGQIKVNRFSEHKENLQETIGAHVAASTLIGIFPEGTRSPHRDEMLKAFTGIAQFALRHHIPIIPVGIKGTYEVMAKHDLVPRLKKVVEINVGTPLHFPNHYDKHTDKQICTFVTEHVIRDIERLSGKKYLHYES